MARELRRGETLTRIPLRLARSESGGYTAVVDGARIFVAKRDEENCFDGAIVDLQITERIDSARHKNLWRAHVVRFHDSQAHEESGPSRAHDERNPSSPPSFTFKLPATFIVVFDCTDEIGVYGVFRGCIIRPNPEWPEVLPTLNSQHRVGHIARRDDGFYVLPSNSPGAQDRIPDRLMICFDQEDSWGVYGTWGDDFKVRPDRELFVPLPVRNSTHNVRVVKVNRRGDKIAFVKPARA